MDKTHTHTERTEETIDITGSRVRLPVAALVAILAAVATAGGVWFVTQGALSAHEIRLVELKDTPQRLHQLERDDQRHQVEIDALQAQSTSVQQLLIRIDERTQQTAKDITELKARAK